MIAQALVDDDAEDIVRAVVKKAKAGESWAAKLVIERILPPARERPVSLDLPQEIGTAAGINQVSAAILRAVAEGELTPSEGNVLAGIVEARRRTIETEELERRIAALEEKKP